MTEEQQSFFSDLNESFHALERDLKKPGQASISTIRNYQFAILAYKPQEEFKMRRLLQKTERSLTQKGWSILCMSLLQVLMKRLKESDSQYLERLIKREKRFYQRDPERGFSELERALSEHLEGTDGIVKECGEIIEKHIAADPTREERTVIFITRAGALYPFFRSSALLRHLNTTVKFRIPIVLLYPGTRHGEAGLSFMDKLNPDRDYRPRIY